jgi:hypothetical protein
MRFFALSFFLSIAAIFGANAWVQHLESRDLPSPALLAQWGPGQAFQMVNYDGPRAKQALALARPRAALVVVGSSHLLLLNEKAHPGLQNLSEGGSNLEYQILTWQWLVDHGRRPDVLLLSADPFNLNDEQIFDYHVGRDSGAYARFIRRSSLPVFRKAWLLLGDLSIRFQVFFYNYLGYENLRRSLWVIRHRARTGLVPLTAITSQANGIGFLPDGSQVCQGCDQEQAEPADLAAAVRRAEPHRPDLMGHWSLSPARLELMRCFLADVKSQGTRVWLLGTPEHPDYRAYQEAHYGQAYREFASAMQSLQAEGLADRVLLAWDPQAAGCGEADFIDGSHFNRACSDRLLHSLSH